MKIKDVVVEGALDDFKTGLAKGKNFADKVLTPSRWINPNSQFGKGWNNGEKFAKKVLSPWGSSGSTAKSSSSASAWQSKNALKKAVGGEVLQSFDRQALKRVHQDIQDGKIKADQNTIQVLKSAYSNQQLSDEQRQQLQQLLQQY